MPERPPPRSWLEGKKKWIAGAVTAAAGLIGLERAYTEDDAPQKDQSAEVTSGDNLQKEREARRARQRHDAGVQRERDLEEAARTRQAFGEMVQPPQELTKELIDEAALEKLQIFLQHNLPDLQIRKRVQGGSGDLIKLPDGSSMSGPVFEVGVRGSSTEDVLVHVLDDDTYRLESILRAIDADIVVTEDELKNAIEVKIQIAQMRDDWSRALDDDNENTAKQILDTIRAFAAENNMTGEESTPNK